MKRIIIVLAAACIIVFAGTASAFNFAVGGRVAGITGLDSLNSYTGGVGATMVQGQVLLGPLELGIGVIPGVTGVYPISVGFLSKFPIPVVQPYLGTELTYFLAPELNSTSVLSIHMFMAQIKGGAEVKFGSIGVYGGLGYGVNITLISLLSQPALPLIASGINWEVGARYYLF